MAHGISSIPNDTQIYVVHALKGYEFQENHVKTLFAAYGLNFSFMTDGDPSLTNETILKEYFSTSFIQKASVGGLSCTLNHILAYKALIKSNSKYAIVFENDPIFLPNFKEKIGKVFSELKELKAGFIVSLENTTLRFPSLKQTKKGKTLYKAKTGRMAGAYIIDLEGAKKAIEHLNTQKCSDIIDWWHNELISCGVLDMYWAHPALVEQGSHNGLMSGTISTKSKSTLRRLSWLFHKYYKLSIGRITKKEKRLIEN